MALSSLSGELSNDISYTLHQPEPISQLRQRASLRVQIHLNVTFRLERLRRDILTGAICRRAHNLKYKESRYFTESNLATSLGSFISEVGVPAECDAYAACIEDIIEYAENYCWNSTNTIYFLEANFFGEFMEDVIFRSSEAELERINCGMVAANASAIKKTLKRKRVQNGENCVICMEELTVGSYACSMPCAHNFHGNCIRKWLAKSHYCPVCRYEMPTTADHS